MTDPALHICHSNFASRQSSAYWVHVSEYKKWLASSSQCCWHRIKVQMHWTVLGTHHYDRPWVPGNPIQQASQPTRDWMTVSEYETRVHWLVAKMVFVQKCQSDSSTPWIWSLAHCRLKHSAGIHGQGAAFSAGCVLAYEWSSGRTKIFDPECHSWICPMATLTSCDSSRMYHASPGMPPQWQ
jgi:hypothetical protein